MWVIVLRLPKTPSSISCIRAIIFRTLRSLRSCNIGLLDPLHCDLKVIRANSEAIAEYGRPKAEAGTRRSCWHFFHSIPQLELQPRLLHSPRFVVLNLVTSYSHNVTSTKWSNKLPIENSAKHRILNLGISSENRAPLCNRIFLLSVPESIIKARKKSLIRVQKLNAWFEARDLIHIHILDLLHWPHY